MIDLEIFRNAFKIDSSVPVRNGKYCNFYTTVNGGTVTIYRQKDHDLFKNGKPKKMRKAK